jgi:ATP-dependent DNA ligase
MALALLLDSPVYWRSLPGMESWIKAATVVKEFRGFRKPVLLTTARAAPIPSPHAAVFAHTAAGLHCACLPASAPQPPSGAIWLQEIKHDGFRVIARKTGKRVRL